MFEDDSSSAEEEKETTKNAKNATASNGSEKVPEDNVKGKKKKTSNDDDEDADDDATGKPVGEETEKKPMAGLFDDSSDEDDAVFDDAGAVVGSSAPPSKNQSDLDIKYGVSDAQKKSRERINRIQNITVLEAKRPGEGTSLHMTKLPNVVAIQPTAFDEAEYDENEEEEQYRGYMHNMVRWRYVRDENGDLVRDGEDGSLVRESNTKLVKWSDGSFTLHIGKEAFDIQNVNSSTSDGFTGLNGYVYLSQKATFQNVDKGEDHNEEDQNGGTVLECIGPVGSRLVAKPSSLQSESHKSLTVAVRQRTVKRAKIAQYMTEEDPEKLKQERIKYNEDADKLKQRKRATGTTYRSSVTGGRRPGMNRSYLEDEGYDDTNLRALKKGSTSNYDMDEMDDYGDESDEDYDQSFLNKNRRRQRKAVEEESDDDEEMVFDDDDEEVVNIHKKKKTAAVLDDDE